MVKELDSHGSWKISAATFLSEGIHELKLIIQLGWPNSINAMIAYLPKIGLLIFIQDLDELAAAGMAVMWTNVTGVSLIVGSCTGLGPLISQAFGAQNYDRVGNLFQRQVWLHFMFICLPVAILWFFSAPLLLAAGQPPRIVALVATFACALIPSLPALALQRDLSIFYQSQRVTQLPMFITMVSSVLNLALYWLLLASPYRIGFLGGPIAQVISAWVQCLALIAYAPRVLPASWPSGQWSVSVASQGLWELIRLSLPGTAMLLAEWWGWELNLFLAGWTCPHEEDAPMSQMGLNTTEKGSSASCIALDVFPIASNTMVFSFFVHMGFSTAAAAHVGNLVGEGDAKRAKVAATITFFFVGIISAAMATLLVYTAEPWTNLFATDVAVIATAVKIMPLVAVYIFFDALGPGFMNNVLRSVNHVAGPAAINCASFYVLGIPLGAWYAEVYCFC